MAESCFGKGVRAASLALCLTFASAASGAEAEVVPTSPYGAPDVSDPCGAEAHLEAQLARDPALAARRRVLEEMVRRAEASGLIPGAAERLNSTSSVPIYTIPVVVHIVHSGLNGDPENISDLQVLSQIAAINRDAQNALNYGSPAADCQLKFCLASKGPTGLPVSWPGAAGITRKLDPVNCVVPITNDAALKAIDYFPSDQYLNVWVVKQITGGGNGGSILGYATFPGSVPAAQDGIVMDYRVMGANNTGYGTTFALLPTLEEGKVFAHEVGHWLDLFHTFHNACTPGDLVGDTPPEAVLRTNCPTNNPTSCSNSGDPIHNFMDYTNDLCRWEFTSGQKSRMYAAISTYRSVLVGSSNLITVGACPPSVTALITATPSQVCANAPVQLSTPSCASCTYTWTFQGGTGNTNGQSTTATFSAPGPHQVTLTVTNGTVTSNATSTVYASACAPITGPCTNWVFGINNRLSFASGIPQSVPGTVNAGPETATQISDNAGTLLFYTDNKNIWSAQNNLAMPNSAAFNTAGGGNSAHTGALIVPRPSTPGQYFLFSVNEWEKYFNFLPPLTITTINMNLNAGLGGVTSTCVPVPLPVGVTASPRGLIEGLTLIPHCNATDWWLITCGMDSSNTSRDWERFVYVTLITSAGAGATTQYPIGFTTGAGGGGSAWGTLTASKDGTKLAICQSQARAVHVYNFNRATGTPTLALDTGDVGANQDVAFSPNGKVIYYSYLDGTYSGAGNGLWGLRQMDLATQQVRVLRPPTSITGPQDVQLGPDDKIYVSRAGASVLDCVNYPDNFNALSLNECGFNYACIPLGGPNNPLGALPNTLAMCSASSTPAAFTYSVSNCYTVTFTSPNCGGWTWNFGDNSALGSGQTVSHTYSGAGTYQVLLTAAGASPSTITIPVTLAAALPISIAGPGSMCGGPANYSVVGPSNYVYTWTITGGTPATATGNNVFVSWGLSTGFVQVTGTDPKTGCTSSAGIGLEACSICTEPPKNMVAWWPLDEPSGSLAQDIVNANDGQDFNVPLKVTGAVSKARQFNGATSYVRVDDDPKLDLGTGNLTIDSWIKSSSSAAYQGIIEKRSLSPDLGYALYLKQGRLAFLLGDGSTSTEFTGPNTANLADGTWHHVAVTEDRGNTAAGTTLYVDGSPILVLPGYSPAGNLDNNERVLIGAQEPSAAPVYCFDGSIDEVEIFSRALSADEVSSIWGSGSAGKCKELTYVPKAQTFCTGQTFALVDIWLCNSGATSQIFNLAFAAGSGPGCNVAGPSAISIFPPQNGTQVNVPTGCTKVTLKIVKPLGGMVSGDLSCYTVTSTNTTSGVSRLSRGSMRASDQVCPLVSLGGIATTGVFVPTPVSFGLYNSSPSVQSYQVRVEASPANADPNIPPGPGGPQSVVSLNGLPPGVPYFTNFLVAPGEVMPVDLEAMFMEPAPFQPYDVVMAVDVDGNGSTDAEATFGMLNSQRVIHITDVPGPPVTEALELMSVSPNPFHHVMGVQLQLPRAERVKLVLCDVSGRRVRTLVDGQLEAGRSLRMVEAAGLRNGVYFLRLEMAGQVRTKRVVLLRE